MIKDYYKILEIEDNFTEDLLKKKYRELSKKYHPDINPDGVDKFKDINEAYDILSDSEKKRRYDFERSGGNQFGFGNPFEDFFNFNNNRQHKWHGVDTILKLTITPIESFNGSERVISYKQKNPCNSCSGTGGQTNVCNNCGGAGRVQKNISNAFFTTRTVVTCGVCNGLGTIITKTCNTCGGAKTFEEDKEIRINIPVGSDSGQFLKLDGLGNWENGYYGNLILQVDVDNTKDFQKINNDLVYNLYLDDTQMCAEKYIVPHPKGELSINALDVFDTSKPLRVRGRGYSGGDFYVNLHIKFKRT
jgi:molecular chaperone DnaJ